jgi:hypothetical protein
MHGVNFECLVNSPTELVVYKSKTDLTSKWVKVTKEGSAYNLEKATCQGDVGEFGRCDSWSLMGIFMIARHNQMILRPKTKITLVYLHQKLKNDYRKCT